MISYATTGFAFDHTALNTLIADAEHKLDVALSGKSPFISETVEGSRHWPWLMGRLIAIGTGDRVYSGAYPLHDESMYRIGPTNTVIAEYDDALKIAWVASSTIEFADSLTARYTTRNGERYHLGYATRDTEGELTIGTRPEHRHRFAVLDVLCEGSPTVRFDPAWDKFNCLRFHNLNHRTLTVTAPGTTLTMDPLTCRTIRVFRSTDGAVERAAVSTYLWAAEADDPGFMEAGRTARFDLAPERSYLANPIIAPVVLLRWAEAIVSRDIETDHGFEVDPTELCDLSSEYAGIFGDPALSATRFGDLLTHRGTFKTRRTLGDGTIEEKSHAWPGYTALHAVASPLAAEVEADGTIRLVATVPEAVEIREGSTNLFDSQDARVASVSAPGELANSVRVAADTVAGTAGFVGVLSSVSTSYRTLTGTLVRPTITYQAQERGTPWQFTFIPPLPVGDFTAQLGDVTWAAALTPQGPRWVATADADTGRSGFDLDGTFRVVDGVLKRVLPFAMTGLGWPDFDAASYQFQPVNYARSERLQAPENPLAFTAFDAPYGGTDWKESAPPHPLSRAAESYGQHQMTVDLGDVNSFQFWAKVRPSGYAATSAVAMIAKGFEWFNAFAWRLNQLKRARPLSLESVRFRVSGNIVTLGANALGIRETGLRPVNQYARLSDSEADREGWIEALAPWSVAPLRVTDLPQWSEIQAVSTASQHTVSVTSFAYAMQVTGVGVPYLITCPTPNKSPNYPGDPSVYEYWYFDATIRLRVDPPVATSQAQTPSGGIDRGPLGRLPLPTDGYVWITDAQAGSIASALGLPFYRLTVGRPVALAQLDPVAGSIAGTAGERTVTVTAGWYAYRTGPDSASEARNFFRDMTVTGDRTVVSPPGWRWLPVDDVADAQWLEPVTDWLAVEAPGYTQQAVTLLESEPVFTSVAACGKQGTAQAGGLFGGGGESVPVTLLPELLGVAGRSQRLLDHDAGLIRRLMLVSPHDASLTHESAVVYTPEPLAVREADVYQRSIAYYNASRTWGELIRPASFLAPDPGAGRVDIVTGESALLMSPVPASTVSVLARVWAEA